MSAALKTRHSGWAWLLRAVSGALILAASVHALSATAATPMPSNARPLQYREAWECNRGFVQAGETCVAMKIPANGYLSSSGTRWECKRGFVKQDDRCSPVNVPAH